MRIDAHQHFWRLARGDYGWLTPELAAIHRDFLPGDLAPHLDACGIDRTVLVQAAETVDETRWLLGLADAEPRVAGVVGWVDLAAADARATVDELAAHPRLVGLRPMLQDIGETDWVLGEAVLDALGHVAAKGLAFDALIQPRHLATIDELARRVPSLRIVVDHVAKPRIVPGHPPDAEWLAGMDRLAAHPQVHCKLSGMANECGAGWTAEDLAPYAAAVLERFGAERLLWGSDWPVLELVGTYEDWHEAALGFACGLDEAGRAALFGGNAVRFYRLDGAPGGAA